MCNDRCLWRRKTCSTEGVPQSWRVRRGCAHNSTEPWGHLWYAHWPAYKLHVGRYGPCNNMQLQRRMGSGNTHGTSSSLLR